MSRAEINRAFWKSDQFRVSPEIYNRQLSAVWSGRVSCIPIEIDPADSGLSSRRQVSVSERLVTGGS